MGGKKCCRSRNISKQMLRILSINLSIHKHYFWQIPAFGEYQLGELRATIWATGAESLIPGISFYPQLNAFFAHPNYILGFPFL